MPPNGVFQHLCNSRDVHVFSTIRDLAGEHHVARTDAEDSIGVGGIAVFGFSASVYPLMMFARQEPALAKPGE
jgi:hypothetical protein